MRNPRDMRTIQIEITNACVRSCSNCTRFCGHHKKPFYMDFETFKSAVDSLEGFEGIVGIMGGEPTLHPDFKQMAEYLGKKFGRAARMNANKLALRDFSGYTASKHQAGAVLNKCGGAGLWTSVTKQYYKYYELIQETFDFQNLNDHTKVSYHQPVLVTRREYGISDDEWLNLRDNCWIQNYWSASVSPKGVFFCEVAAALDVLFEGPGGFPIEKGWWRSDVSEFEPQFHWCEMCGAALDTFGRFKRNANEYIDDVSPALHEKLKSMGSKKLEAGGVRLFTATKDKDEDSGEYGSSRYVEFYSDRFGDSLERLRPNRLDNINVAKIEGSLGRAVYNQIKTLGVNGWVLLSNGENPFVSGEEIQSLYLNPGVCYVKDGQILFNTNAASFKQAGYSGFYGCERVEDIQNLWNARNVAYLDESFMDGVYDSDITRWRIMTDEDVINDYAFRNRLYLKINEAGIKRGGAVVILTAASFYFGHAAFKLVENMGYCAHLFVSAENGRFYAGLVPDEKLHIFKNSHTYELEKIKSECDSLIERLKFDGAIVLISVPYPDITDRDGYNGAAETGGYLAEQFIGCVNIRRRFSELRQNVASAQRSK